MNHASAHSSAHFGEEETENTRCASTPRSHPRLQGTTTATSTPLCQGRCWSTRAMPSAISSCDIHVRAAEIDLVHGLGPITLTRQRHFRSANDPAIGVGTAAISSGCHRPRCPRHVLEEEAHREARSLPPTDPHSTSYTEHICRCGVVTSSGAGERWLRAWRSATGRPH